MAQFFQVDEVTIINLDLVTDLYRHRAAKKLIVTLAAPDFCTGDERATEARAIQIPEGPAADRLWKHVSHVAEDNLRPIA
jgi:hypothetical protein